MDEKKKGIITLCVVVSLISILVAVSSLSKGESSSGSGENNTVDDSELTSINFISYDDFMSKVESGEKAIYVLGQTTCGYCTMYKPIINEVASKYDVEFNYININTLESEQRSNIEDSIDYLKDNDWGTPLTLIVENNEVIDKINGYTDEDGVVEFLKKNEFIEE